MKKCQKMTVSNIWEHVREIRWIRYKLWYGGEIFKQTTNNIFSMLLGILNKNDPYTSILTYNKDRQNKHFKELLSNMLRV